MKQTLIFLLFLLTAACKDTSIPCQTCKTTYEKWLIQVGGSRIVEANSSTETVCDSEELEYIKDKAGAKDYFEGNQQYKDRTNVTCK